MLCIQCKSETKNPKFCTNSCSAKYNNIKRKNKSYCLLCHKELKSFRNKYCSHQCNKDHVWLKTVNQIEIVGCADNHRQANKYITYKRGHQCSICKITNWLGNPIPMVLDHIDGDANNHKLDNIRLVCSNCDSQLPTYKSKNKTGRHKRKLRYQKGKSY